jgi:hypothetical protein
MPQEAANNPLINPCLCRGSIAYVHKDCILRWIRTSENREQALICQLCLQPLTLPTQRPLESIPRLELEGRMAYAIKYPSILISLTYYAYIAYASEFAPQFDYPIGAHAIKALKLYIILLSMCTGFYGAYYASLFMRVVNKRVYFQYMANRRFLIVDFFSIRAYILLLVLNGIASGFRPIPFGALYLVLLSRFFSYHVAVLEHMNYDAKNHIFN